MFLAGTDHDTHRPDRRGNLLHVRIFYSSKITDSLQCLCEQNHLFLRRDHMLRDRDTCPDKCLLRKAHAIVNIQVEAGFPMQSQTFYEF